jgi:hypothetical protein
MGLIAGTSFLAGAVLGFRFNVWALIPASLLVALGVAAIDGFVDLWSLVLTLIVTVTSTQAGYLVGAAVNALFEVGAKQNIGAGSRSNDALGRPVR